MSYVTDLVFIAVTGQDATAFQDAFEQHQKYRPHPLGSTDHCTSLWVFHIGVDYMNPDLYAWLTAATTSCTFVELQANPANPSPRNE